MSTEQVLSWLLEGQWPFLWPQQEGQANDTVNDVPPLRLSPLSARGTASPEKAGVWRWESSW